MMTIKSNLKLAVLIIFLIFVGVFYFGKQADQSESENAPDLESTENDLQIFSPKTIKKIRANSESNSEVEEKAQFDTAVQHVKTRELATQRNPEKTELAQQPLPMSPAWKIWQTVRAIKLDIKPPPQDLIGEFNHFYIVQSSNLSPSDMAHFDRAQPLVVFNERLGKVGLVTGLIKVETSDRVQLENFLTQQDARIFDSFEEIHTYFISGISSPFNLNFLFNHLKAQGFVVSIELEITGIIYEKK